MPNLKLNIFALPNQTTILFSLIVLVILGAIFAGNLGSPVCIWPLAMGLLLLPLRAYLAWPEREFRANGLSLAGDEFFDLKKIVSEEAQLIGLPRVPKLAIGDDNTELHIFGSFRHWYIALSCCEALHLQVDLQDSRRMLAVRAMFIHELYHFKNGDYWQMGYARELLRLTTIFMAWSLALLLGYGIFLLLFTLQLQHFDYMTLQQRIAQLPPAIQQLYQIILPQAEAWTELKAKANEISLSFVIYFVINATLPFVVIGSILWLFYWPKFLRIREIYADAGVAHSQRDIEPLYHALLLNSRSRISPIQRVASRRAKIQYQFTQTLKLIQQKLTPPRFVRKWFSKHPEFSWRLDALEDPSLTYDHWFGLAFSLGGLTLILDVLLATPLTLPYYGQWPMHFSVIIISTIVSLTLLPRLVLGQPVWPYLFKVISVIVAIRFVWIGLTILIMIVLLFLNPEILSNILTAGVVSIARYTRPLNEPVFTDLTEFVMTASIINMAQVFIILASLITVIGGNLLLLRRLLTWYRLPKAGRYLVRIGYGVIALTPTFFGLSILPAITLVLLQSNVDPPNPLTVIGMGLFGLTITVVGLGCFFYGDRRYSRHCPKCGTFVAEPYQLGQRCRLDGCNELFHPWFIAEYKS